MRFLYCAGIYLFLALSCDLAAAKENGPVKCGTTFAKTTGTIQNNTLHPNTQCVYHITPTNANETIRLFLKKLLLDSEDNVTITEADKAEPLFPAFHGQESAVPLITNSKDLTITINVSSVSNIVRHFEAFYDAISVECIFKVDDDMLLTQQPLTTDNKITECKLQYIIEPNVARALSFETFDLSSGSSVDAIYVDNPGTFSGTDRPPDFYSHKQATFDAKISSGDSFLLRQYKLNGACSDYVLVDGSTTIKTPEEMPKLNNGSLLLECRWLLENTKDIALQFSLKSINLTDPYDVLLIADGPHFNSPVLHQITSSTQLQDADTVFVASGKTLTISFKTSSVHSSFEAEVADAEENGPVKCGEVFAKTTGTIQNNTLHPNTQCVYHITPTNANQTIRLFLKKLLLDSGDSVTITEADKAEPLFPAFRGQESAVPLITNSKDLTITINVSSVSNIVRHFEAFYDAISVECIFKVDDDMLLTQQPLTTDNITAECKLQYNVEPNVTRALSFETFDLSSNSTVTASNVENPGTFSETDHPPDFYSHEQAMFDTKISSGDSFLLRQYKLNGACSDYVLVDGSTTIKTPEEMPKLNNGSLLLECRWLLENTKDIALQFSLKFINLTDPYDVLLIADGSHYNSPVLHQITSSEQLQDADTVFVASGKTLTISFKTSSVHSSFEAEVADAEENGPVKCGEVFAKTTGTIQNNTLHPNTQCVYHITPTNANQTIRLFLKKLLLDSEDNVTITEADEEKPLFPTFRGQETAVPLITNSKNLTITIMTSSVANIVRHFEAFYDAISVECLFKVDDDMLLTQQPLTTDNKTTECKLQYIIEPNVARALSFETFDLSSGSSVEASDVENPGGTFSGTDRPPDFYSHKQATFDTKISPLDSFLLHQYKLNGACSNYLPVTGSNTIKTPEEMPKLNNGSLLLECRWLLENKNGIALQFSLKSINLTDPYDVLLMADGPHFNSPVLHQITSATQLQAPDTVVITSGKFLTVSFKTSTIHSKFEAEIKDAGQGRYIENNGTLLLKQTTIDSTWLLQTEPNETAVLHFHDSSFASPSTVNIYDGFNTNSKYITSLHGNVWYPILSTTSKMMVVATDFKQGGFEADFSGSAVGCMHMSQGSSDTYTLSKHCNSTCAWIIPPINSSGTDLLLDLQFISLEDGDFIEVLQLDPKASLATVKPGTTHIPQLNVKSQSGAYVNITRGACKKPNDIILVAQANYIPECVGKMTLAKAQQIELTSPGFPNTYPLFENCRWILTTNPPKQLIHVAFANLRLAPNHCLILSENGSSPMKYTGSDLPPDLFFTNDVIVDFNSGKCDPAMKSVLMSDQGFLANVTSTVCGKVFTESSGLFLTQANESLCIWQISLPPPTEKGSVSTIIFTVKQKDRTGNYKLDIHDGNSVRDIVIENSTESEMWSRTNTLIIVYRVEDPSKPATQLEFNYTTKICGESEQCKNKICLHPDWKCNGINDCGDFTDETGCGPQPVGPTTTPAPPSPVGISSTTFGVTIFFMFILGGVLTVIMPIMYRKVRNGQYSQFRDVSVIE